MDKLMVFEQGTLPSVDWIAAYQRSTFVPYIQMGFKAIRHYFISRSYPALSNALTHVEDTLTTTAELFDKAEQIIITTKEAKNLRSSAPGLTRDQHQPRVVVVVAATPFDQTSEAVSANEGDRLAAAREGGRPGKGRGRGKAKTNTTSSLGPGAAARTPWSQYGGRELCMQRYDDNNAPLMYVRIQVGQASCIALLDSGASRNFMSQTFMQRAGLGAQVRRKANPTAIKLADGKTQQLLDRYIEAVPVYFAPHACEPVTFDIMDTDFDIILGMPWLASADHTVNFHRRTLSVRDAFGAEMACTIPLTHPSIRCQVVTTKSFRVTCAYEQPEEIGLCFLWTVAVADSSPMDLSSDPRVVWLLDEFADIFESPTGVVPDRPISHEIILEAGVVPLKGCIYRMSKEELEVLRTQLNDLLAKGWIRPSSSPYGAPVLFVRKNKDLRLCIDYCKLNVQTVKNAGPLPRIDDLLERLGSAKYFSKLDLKSGYHQISIRPNDRYKSAFKTRWGLPAAAPTKVMKMAATIARAAPEKFYVALYSAGHKDWRSFGRATLDMEAKLHVQAPSSDRRKGAFPRGGRKGKAAFAYAGSRSASDTGSQPEMHRIFRPYLDKFMVVYLDDILVFSRTAREHAEHLTLVLQSLRESQYKINREKSSFGVTSVIYLGHVISGDGLAPKAAKIAAIQEWPQPQTVGLDVAFHANFNDDELLHDRNKYMVTPGLRKRINEKLKRVTGYLSFLQAPMFSRGIVDNVTHMVLWNKPEDEADRREK
ncbi:hypothetical protein CBR_g22864 [Chara braunii]|uniref:Reverse transcriptase domain-containing protein n=1 Tax=Chara braunii TaxID=69332 RepID=A0A388L318_CHABU|nr:hypothetical protein CBR_g22864 [Chara braunii]|eukprot:GBG76648.1 hypothetical protein CBR_g22864 [Chara braunii]